MLCTKFYLPPYRISEPVGSSSSSRLQLISSFAISSISMKVCPTQSSLPGDLKSCTAKAPLRQDSLDFMCKMLLGVLKLDIATNGPWEELEEVVDRTVREVVPILLGILESEGRSVKPCLIHGDLWEGNISTETGTGNIFFFDACSYYAHNEMELGIWRTDHHRMKSEAYTQEYLRVMKPSEPRDQWDDRNRLYSCKTRLMYSAHVPGTPVRTQ